MPKADLASLSPMVLVTGLVLPALISERVSRAPLNMLLLAVPLKLATSLLMWHMVHEARLAYEVRRLLWWR
jgi:hypothetical protein